MAGEFELGLGARVEPDGSTRFRVWAPKAERLAVNVLTPGARAEEMQRGDGDVFEARIADVGAGSDYRYLINGELARPDPVSRWQPQGVHGPSRIVDPGAFAWGDGSWKGIPPERLVCYELHVGTFTAEGTFAAVIPKLPYLRNLGVTAVELMPVAEFPGRRNWGYDGVHLYAPQSTYGGPHGLKSLVDACHREGLAAVLDVVYNHLGPEGNYLSDFAPYLTDRYRGPWGDAINFDGADSDGVRRHFLLNALYWFSEYHLDALRLDAIHAIFDFSARHLLAEMQARSQALALRSGRPAYLIAESDLNDVRVLNPAARGGHGLAAQWSDDFHHALRTVLTGDRRGYFADFGRLEDLRKAFCDGFVVDGGYSRFRRRSHGSSSVDVPGRQFVVCTQNHDQIANGSGGDRLSTRVGIEQQKLSAVALWVAPFLPLLFMGQEFGETAPFLYFVDHGDPGLVAAVREGRRREHAAFHGADAFPDPQAESTFARSRMDWGKLERSPHREILRLYRDLTALRRAHPALSNCRKDLTRAAHDEGARWLRIERRDPVEATLVALFNFQGTEQPIPLPPGGAAYRLLLASSSPQYAGPPGGTLPPPQIKAAAGAEAAIPCPAWSATLYLKTEAKDGP
jgi:maltooligosyltrehalose trehalohydrolase